VRGAEGRSLDVGEKEPYLSTPNFISYILISDANGDLPVGRN